MPNYILIALVMQTHLVSYWFWITPNNFECLSRPSVVHAIYCLLFCKHPEFKAASSCISLALTCSIGDWLDDWLENIAKKRSWLSSKDFYDLCIAHRMYCKSFENTPVQSRDLLTGQLAIDRIIVDGKHWENQASVQYWPNKGWWWVSI